MDAKIPQNHVGHLYDRIAPVYDIWAGLTESKARNRALDLADVKDGEDILEVAVGTGVAFYEIAVRNPNGTNTGIDLSIGMLSKAKKRLQSLPHGNYHLNIGTAFELEMANESVDTLLNQYMFDLLSLEDIKKILLEFKRVLRPGGKLILTNMTEAEQFCGRIYDLFYRISPGLMGGCRAVKLSGLIENTGFKIDKREYHQQMLFPSEVIRAFK
jgi:ubiquinone/menaquinone biosynthesis C-methylase UbiE